MKMVKIRGHASLTESDLTIRSFRLTAERVSFKRVAIEL
jgi:hypothetical protein